MYRERGIPMNTYCQFVYMSTPARSEISNTQDGCGCANNNKTTKITIIIIIDKT